MGSAIEIGIRIRKLVFISIRGVYRSACHHPFLLGFLGFLLFLYRYFPFLFSLLVSASPVLVCTALLLGTLLSFGQPNVPEFEEKEERVTHGISSFQTGFSEGETIVSDRDASYFVRGYSEIRSDVEESGIDEANVAGEKDDRTEKDPDLVYDSALDRENLMDVQPENQVKEDVEREFRSFELGKSNEVRDGNLTSEVVSSDDEAIEKQYVMVQKEDDDDIFEIENGKVPGGEYVSLKEGDADCSPSSSWKQVENNSDEDDDSEDSGSDGAESSSPDASMADIIPMLDELHPLLDIDAPQPAHLSHDGSDAASEKSHKSDDDDHSVESDDDHSVESDDDHSVESDDDHSAESDEDVEKLGEAEEDGVDEEEEEMEGGKEDESKSAIKWTEDDQKNLMDLGTLELERNRRLENLIARRMARRLMTEKNLIDLDSTDIPYNVAPISIRRNPFDFPDESYAAAMGLPPIPGSAPSILQPRRNPFDIPYDPNEEKPDLKRDSFQQEFTHFNQKDAVFRRHESFNIGPSVFGISKQERHDISWKPVFISERMASEGTSYFQRQSSEVSDSKLSSVQDTESVSSGDQDERKFSEQDLSPEAELTSNTEHVFNEAGHGSASSEENESVEMIQAEESNVFQEENEIVLGGVEDPSEMEFYPTTGEVEIDEQFNDGETHLRRESSVEVSSSRSSQSSRSEVIDDIPDDESEKTANLQHEDGHIPESRISTQISVEESRISIQSSVEESGISTQTSVEESNLQHISREVEDTQLVEPVYDSSPSAAEKLISFSSASSDSAAEISETVLPPVSVDTTADLADKESEARNDRLDNYSSGHEKTQAASSELHAEVENEMRSEKSEDIDQHNVAAEGSSAVIPNSVDQNGSTVGELVDSKFSSDAGSQKGVTDSGMVREQDIENIFADSETLHQDNVESPDSNYEQSSEKLHLIDNESAEEVTSRQDNEEISVPVQDDNEIPDSVATDAHHIPSNSSHMHAPGDSQFSLVETEHLEKKRSNEEHIFPVEQDNVFLSSSVEQGNTKILQDLDNNMVSCTSDSQHEVDVKSPSDLENHLSSSDKLVDAQSSSGHDESQNSDDIKVEPSQDAGTSNYGVGELHDDLDETSVNSDTPELRSPISESQVEVYKQCGKIAKEDQNEALQNLVPSAEGFMSLNNEENINEFDHIIDEEFLSELDTVGDFSVGDAGVLHHTDIVHDETRDAQLSSLPEDVKTAEVEQDNDIPVLEARSLEDIDIAFKQLQEGVDVNDVILPSTIKDQLGSEECKDHVEVNSDLQVIEARSLEDIDVVIKEISKDNQGELPEKLDAADNEQKTDVSTNAEEISRTTVDKSENVSSSSSSNK
ncbi:uncharacterized protein LOC127126548 isoform X1 [Lathyrus oleraceus]|uniref:Uncharacterized protein n=1 Tax=Pisum sativum TaxID=3888 RepID=A0A9D4XUB8_PEA|nr:uncharacterized protein LOC127126548 isoform X1 [Pisum sativum]KAI5427571.1 hypothetical protein KIW84_032828 [Pisum sativum]